MVHDHLRAADDIGLARPLVIPKRPRGLTLRGRVGVVVSSDAVVRISGVAMGGNGGPGIDILPKGVTPNGEEKLGNKDLDWPKPPEWDPAKKTVVGTVCPVCLALAALAVEVVGTWHEHFVDSSKVCFSFSSRPSARVSLTGPGGFSSVSDLVLPAAEGGTAQRRPSSRSPPTAPTRCTFRSRRTVSRRPASRATS